MSDDRFFKDTDCNIWLAQVAYNRDWIMYSSPVIDEGLIVHFLRRNIIAVWISILTTVIAIVWMMLLGMCKCAINQMHGIIIIWLAVQIPYVVLSTRLFALIPSDDVQKTIDEFENFAYLNIASFAAQQFMVMGLVMCISLAVAHFKRHHQQMILNPDIRPKLAQSLQREQAWSCCFFMFNFLFQVPLFIWQNVQYVRVTEANEQQMDNEHDDQPWNRHIAHTAIAFGIISMLIIAIYVLMMLARIPTLCMTISRGGHGWCSMLALYIIVPGLMVLYINDVLAMMMFYWGSPAFKMTSGASGCLRYIGIEENEDGPKQFTLTAFGVFLNVIFNVSQWTPIVWSIVFLCGFRSMLRAERTRRQFNKRDKADQKAMDKKEMDMRADLIKRQNENINLTTSQNTTQTMTLEQSRNLME